MKRLNKIVMSRKIEVRLNEKEEINNIFLHEAHD